MTARRPLTLLLALLLAGTVPAHWPAQMAAAADVPAAAAGAPEAVPGGVAEAPDEEAPPPAAEEEEADTLFLIAEADTSISEWKWTHRPLVIFADTPRDPRVEEQLATLRVERERLVERDVVVIVDTDASLGTALRRELRPRGFMIVLVEKDGLIAFRRPSPRSGREILHAIDKLPMRREEMRER